MEYFCTFTRVKLKKQYFYFYWSNILLYVSVLLLKYLICVLCPPLQESQAKTVPSATAEEIQGLTSNPENFLFRGHRKCSDSVHLSVVW